MPNLEQRVAGQQGAAEEKPKKKSLVDIVKAYTINPLKKIPEYKDKALLGIDGIIGSGIARSAIPMYFTTAVAVPAFLVNPIAGLVVGAGTFLCSYALSNTAYKLPRDLLKIVTFPILHPVKLYMMIKGAAAQGIKNPFKAISAILGGTIGTALRSPGYLLSYPFTAEVFDEGKNEKGEKVKKARGKVNKIASLMGSLAGGLGALSVMNPGGLTGALSSAKDTIYSAASSGYEAVKPYLPTFTFKDGTPVSQSLKSMYGTTKNFIASLAPGATYQSNLIPIETAYKSVAAPIETACSSKIIHLADYLPQKEIITSMAA